MKTASGFNINGNGSHLEECMAEDLSVGDFFVHGDLLHRVVSIPNGDEVLVYSFIRNEVVPFERYADSSVYKVTRASLSYEY